MQRLAKMNANFPQSDRDDAVQKTMEGTDCIANPPVIAYRAHCSIEEAREDVISHNVECFDVSGPEVTPRSKIAMVPKLGRRVNVFILGDYVAQQKRRRTSHKALLRIKKNSRGMGMRRENMNRLRRSGMKLRQRCENLSNAN